ncbi:MAG: long-chain fatty acid--CoA ligase, partial [Leucobacter sp.]|nr:long-chain fatty acid--CoA ligase [Leucobacter sp.]
VWMPINARSGSDEVKVMLEKFVPRVVFYDPSLSSIVESYRAVAPTSVEFVVLEREQVEAWIGQQGDAPLDQRFDEHAVYAVQPTGGTTGVPKGVQFTHKNAEYVALSFEAICPFTPTSRNPRPVLLASAPLSHAAGQVMQLIMRQGGLCVISNQPIAELPRIIDEHAVTHMFVPPTVIYGLIDLPHIHSYNYDSLQYMLYGAAPISPVKLGQAVSIFGPVLAQIYGQTETGVPNLYLAPQDHFRDGDPANGIADASRLGAAGRPTPLIDMAIIDDDGQPVVQGERGEIAVKGFSVSPGYDGDPEATAESMKGEWFLTGDVAFEDDEGFVHIVARKKEFIITGGFNVYSAEVERALLAQEGVQECAVFGVPDEKWGEAVVAVLEPVSGVAIDVAAVTAGVKEMLGSVKTPKHLEVTDTLPRTPTGKVFKREIRATYLQRHGLQTA